MSPPTPAVPQGMHAIEGEHLVKRYPNGVLANDDVSIAVPRAAVHAIVGENGAGKSTLLKMLYGLETPSAGLVRVDGRPCRFRGPRDAIAAGIGLVPQHAQLVPSMSVAENVLLGAEFMRGPFVDTRRAQAAVDDLARRFGLRVDPRSRAGGLAVGAQQRVEMLKALHRGARVLLLDEPTTLLTPQECDALFESLALLVSGGLTVVLISHRLAEVRQVASGFTVLRAGRVAGRGRTADVSEADLAGLIVGARVEGRPVARVDARGRTPRLVVQGLSLRQGGGKPLLDRVDLTLAPGEILGVAGVEGNGQNHLIELLCGMREPSAGHIALDGRPLAADVREARRRGLGCVPEDRLHDGAAPGLSITDNCIALDYFRPPASRFGRIDMRRAAQRARALIARHRVRAASESVAIGSLSGGNMQKVIVGRELAAAPRVLIAAQPTRGVDIGAALALREELVALRDGGAAILLISADLDEVTALSDRIAVLFEGRIVAHFAADTATHRELGARMTGLGAGGGADAVLGTPFTPRPAPAAGDLSGLPT